MRGRTLATTGGLSLLTAVAGALATRPVRSPWYQRLRKPGFQPPDAVFPIVWPLLYADVAVTSAATIDALSADGRRGEARRYTALLAANLALNGGWTWLFFTRRRLGAATVAAGVLAISGADLSRRTIGAVGAPGAASVAYPLWCTFATVLSGRIWWLNRAR